MEFDGSLKPALKRLRAALGYPADNPIFIGTIPKRGSRFIAPVAVKNEPGEAATVDAVVVERSQPKTSPTAAGPARFDAETWTSPYYYYLCLERCPAASDGLLWILRTGAPLGGPP